jgi:AcrR family transcriptional regulator
MRRRGKALEDAIRDAACAELAEVGYGAFSMEAVAARARVGKASLYRRFADKQQLAVYAMECGFPQPPPGEITDFFDADATTRDAVLSILRRIAEALAGERGAIMRESYAEAARDRELAELIEERIVAPRRDRMLQILRRGVQRGEVRAAAVAEHIAEVGPKLVIHAVLTEGDPPRDEDLVALVDDVVMPLLQP